MELKVQHLSGSRSGQEDVFDQDTLLLGRNPSSTIRFDPSQDILVSGRHAEIVREGNGWAVRDLGSTNGTYVEGKKVSDHHTLHPGDVIELGKGGPRLRVEWGSATVVGPLPVSSDAGGVVEGRTVMMSLNEGAEAAPVSAPVPSTGRSRAVSGKKKKKGRILLVAVLLFAFLLVGLVGAAFLVRQRNLSRKATPKPAVTAAIAAPVEQAKVEETAEIRQAIADEAAELQRLQTLAEEGENVSEADFERQLRESQRMIEELTRQLQEKNDELSSNRPTPTRRAPPRQTPTGQRSAPARTAPARTAPTQPAPTPETSAQTPQAASAVTPTLVNVKFLRKPVDVQAAAPLVQTSQLPSGIDRELASALSTALLTTGKYVPAKKGGVVSTSMAVTNYKSERRTTVDTKKVTRAADAVAGLFGENVPNSPANVKSQSWDAAIATRVIARDAAGREIVQFETAAEAADRKTSTNVSSLSVGELFRSDTPAGDVVRKVVADAVDGLMPYIDRTEWFATINAHSGTRALIDCGRTCQVEEGDYFDVLDGGTVIGRLRVAQTDENTSTAEVIAGGASGKLTGKTVRYAGREKPSSLYGAAPKPKQLVLRRKAAAFAGPGNSFSKITDLRGGTRLNYLYSVGFWAKASDGKREYWIPIVHAEIRD